MTFDLTPFLRDRLVAWVEFCRRWALWIALASVLSAVGGGVYVANNLSIDTDVGNMLSPDLPFRKRAVELDAAFPQTSDEIVIVVDGATSDITADATARLAERLRHQPDLFGTVFHPESDPFFRKNAFLYMTPAELEQTSDQLAAAQPVLATLWRDPSLATLFDLLGQMLKASTEPGGPSAKDIDKVLSQAARVADAQAAGKFGQFSWREVLTGETGTRELIVIQPVIDYATLHPAAKAIASIRAIAAELKLDQRHGVTLRLTGSGALAHEELLSVENSLGISNVLALAVVCILLFVCLKSIRLVVPVLVTLLVGLVWTAALAIPLVGELNVLSVAFAVLFIGIGVDFGIHFALRYREGLYRFAQEGRFDMALSLRWASAGIGGPLALCAAAAGIGFFSFLPTPYRGLAELGLIAGISMFIAFAANLTVLPALLALTPFPREVTQRLQKAPRPRPFLGLNPSRYGRPVVIGAALLAVTAVIAVPRISFDFDPMRLKDPKSESVRALKDLMRDGGENTPYFITALARNQAEAAEMAARLKKVPAVSRVVTDTSLVPDDQDDKLATIESMALFLSPLFSAPQTPSRQADLVAARTAWQALVTQIEAAPTPASAHLLASLRKLDFSKDSVLQELQRRLLSGLPAQVTTLRDAMMAQPISMTDVPKYVQDRQIASDGRVRVDIYPVGDITRRSAMRGFVHAVQAVVPDVTGTPVTILEAGETVVTALWTATGLTLGALLLLFGLLLRNVRDVVLVFAPLVLAALLTLALMVAFGLAFNFVNIVALPLLFGLGMANGIQFVYRERLESDPTELMRTSTPRAVMFSALATIDSFGSMALSPHQGTASMGIVLGIAITLTLICTIIVLPALMRCFPPRRRGTAAQPV